MTDGRAPSLQGERGSERPNCVGDWKPGDQIARQVARHQRLCRGAARHLRQLLGGRGARTGLQEHRPGGVEAHVTPAADPRYGEFRVEAFNVFNIPSFGPPARDISVPNTFGVITSTISSPRVVELVFKIYF